MTINPYLSSGSGHRAQWRLRRGRERGGPGGLALHLGEAVGVVGEVGEDHALLVVVLAQDLVVAQEEPVAHAEPASLFDFLSNPRSFNKLKVGGS